MALPTILLLGLLASSIPATICRIVSHASEEVSDFSGENENHDISRQNENLFIPMIDLKSAGSITEVSYSGKAIIKKFSCPAIYGRYSHPDSCEYYFECKFGWPTLWHCNSGYLYDEEKEQCRDERKVKCYIGHDRDHNHNRDERDKYRDHKDKHRDHKDKHEDYIDKHRDHKDDIDNENAKEVDQGQFKCPYFWGSFAHPYDCTKYYVCIYNCPKLFQCNENFLYDTHYRKCLPSQKVKCGNRLDRDQMKTSTRPEATTVRPVEITAIVPKITDNKFYCPNPNGRYPDPEDCSRYYECRKFVPHLYICPESTLYDEGKEKCLDMKRVTCGGRPGGNDGVTYIKFYCPFPNGRYPDPEDCSRYYECRFFIPYLYICTESTLYDEKEGKCLDMKRVTCGARPGGNDGGVTSEDNKNANFRCPYVWGTFAHPLDCSKYIVCIYDVPSIFRCRKNQLFDAHYKRCLPKEKVSCNDRINPDGITSKDDKNVNLRCPYPWGTFAHPLDCSKYIVCIYDVPSIFNCRKNELFDVYYRRCLPKERVSCNGRINPDVTDNKFYCPFPNGRYPDPEDCSRYYECHFFVPYLYICPESTLYDERNKRCLDMKRVICGGRPGGNDGGITSEDDKNVNFRCPYPWGTFAHPVDCSKYIVCIYDVPSIFHCWRNELFDAHYKRCLPKERVSCNDRINPNDPYPDGRTASPVINTTLSTTTTPVPTTTTTTPVPTTTTTTPIPTTTTTTPVPTTMTTTPVPTTTTTTPVPTTTTTTPVPTTTTSTVVTTTVSSEATTIAKPSTILPVTKPNTPPPTDCAEHDLDCIRDKTGDVNGWFDCPEQYGHFPHGSSMQLFIHCDNWKPFVKICPDHTVFSPTNLVCVWYLVYENMPLQ